MNLPHHRHQLDPISGRAVLWTFVVILGLFLIAYLSACASLGTAPAKSFDEQLAYAYGVHTAVTNATATALSTGAITVPEATQVEKQIETTRSLLDVAKAAEATNPTQAQSDLTLALSGLNALLTYLNAHLPTALGGK